MDSAQRGITMASPYPSHAKYQPAPYYGNVVVGSTMNGERRTTRRRRRGRLCRILTVALVFVIVSARRMYRRGREHSYFDFLTGLSFDDVAVAAPSFSSSSSWSWSTAIEDKYASAEDAHLVIFYNLYIPPNITADLVTPDQDVVNGDVDNAIRVVKDQMGQISSVLLRMEGEGRGGRGGRADGGNGGNGETTEKKGVVFYNLIGNDAAFPPREISALCRELHPRLECRLMRHYEDAGEQVTLQDLHDYCRIDHNNNKPSDTNTNRRRRRRRRVTYLHSKGSYHSQKENHIWRRIMTDAALHPSCLDPPPSPAPYNGNNNNGTSSSCDVCSAQFYIKYAIMFPGNMWTADCTYVRTLLPPLTDGAYERRKEASIERYLTLRMWKSLDATLDTDNAEHFGLGRYMWEHWVASSPHVRPCEVHGTEVGPLMLLGKDPKGRTFGPEYYDWGMAPRRIDANLGGLRNARLRLEHSPNASFREYYYLPGNLVKWFTLYGPEGVPSQDSWVWRVFPQGDRWKELVGRDGENAVEEMVKASGPRFRSAFVSEDVRATSDTSSQLFHDDDGLLSLSDPPLVVFYQISFPPDKKEKALAVVKSQFDVLSLGQFDNESGAFDRNRKILLYYTITGGSMREIDIISSLCKEKSDRITCRQRGIHDEEGVYGENFHHLHAFCNAKPSYNVVHITNRVDDSLATKIKAITSAVTSTMCLPSEESCNVCGAEFYPLPFLHFTGNMFSASCGYVNKLMSPSAFENAMTDVAGAALVAEVKETYTTKLFPLGARILGSYQHSIEHWIGAHPDLKPCDVAPTSTAKLDATILDQMKLSSRAPAPRRGSASPIYLADKSDWEERESRSRKKRTISLREYYYLAGNILRWMRLYEKLPDANSWVWEWFPDGQLWEAAARTSGENAVHVVANQLSEQLALEKRLAEQLAIKKT